MNITALQNALARTAGHPVSVVVHLNHDATRVFILAEPDDDLDQLIAVAKVYIPEAEVR